MVSRDLVKILPRTYTVTEPNIVYMTITRWLGLSFRLIGRSSDLLELVLGLNSLGREQA